MKVDPCEVRVALVAPTLGILGGQGVQAASLADRLRADGYQVLFVAVNPAFPRGLQWVRRLPLIRTVVNQALYLMQHTNFDNSDIAMKLHYSEESSLARDFRKALKCNPDEARQLLTHQTREKLLERAL